MFVLLFFVSMLFKVCVLVFVALFKDFGMFWCCSFRVFSCLLLFCSSFVACHSRLVVIRRILILHWLAGFAMEGRCWAGQCVAMAPLRASIPSLVQRS